LRFGLLKGERAASYTVGSSPRLLERELPILRRQSKPERGVVSRKKLESMITTAVKQSEPTCEAFVGVVVERETPKTRYDSNWSIRGVRFGKSDRGKAAQVLAAVVKRLQDQFVLERDPPLKRKTQFVDIH
jgi:hypothetical protein